MKISLNTGINQIYKYGTNIPKNPQLQQHNLSLPVHSDEVYFGKHSKTEHKNTLFTKKININKAKILPREVIEKSEKALQKSEQIKKEAYNINLLAEDIFAKSEEIKKLKEIKNYEINDLKAESNELYKKSEKIINILAGEIQNSINQDKDTKYENDKTYVFQLTKNNECLANAYFMLAGGKVKITGAVSQNPNGTKDIITCTQDNKPETVKQGVIDFSQVENFSQNYFWLDSDSNLQSNSLPAYFYTDGNNKLKFVDKENCYIRTEKIFNYKDGVICNIKKNCEEKQNGNYSIEENITFYPGESYCIDNGVTFNNGESKTKSTLWFTKGYVTSYIKDKHHTKKNEYLAAEEYHFFNNNLKKYKQGIVDNEYGPVYTEKELVFNGENLYCVIINSENDDNVSKNEKFFVFANGKPLEYSEGVTFSREPRFLNKKEVLRFDNDNLSCFYSDWNKEEKNKTVKMDSAFKFNNNKLMKADYDVLIKDEVELFIKNSLFFKDDKFVSHKKNHEARFASEEQAEYNF